MVYGASITGCTELVIMLWCYWNCFLVVVVVALVAGLLISSLVLSLAVVGGYGGGTG